MGLFKKVQYPFDTFHKTLKVGRIPFILKLLHPEIKDVVNVSTELPYPYGATKSSDCVVETEDKIYIVEFQTGSKKIRDIHRFIHYYGLVLDRDEYDLKNKKQVIVIIIYTENVEKNFIYKNGIGTFKFETLSLKEFDGDKILKKLKEKINNEIELNWKEKGLLEYIPFFKSKRTPKELLTETIKLTNKEKFLTDTEKQNIKARQMLLASKFTKNEKEMKNMIETIEDLKQLIRNEYRLEGIKEGKGMGRIEGINEGIEKGKKLGKIEGIREGAKEIAKTMLEDNSPIDKIVKYTGLSEKEIRNIQ